MIEDKYLQPKGRARLSWLSNKKVLIYGQFSIIVPVFAPRLAAQLMAAAKVGTSISVQGFYETTPDGMNVIHLVNATLGSQTIYGGPPPALASPTAETIQSFSGGCGRGDAFQAVG